MDALAPIPVIPGCREHLGPGGWCGRPRQPDRDHCPDHVAERLESLGRASGKVRQ